MLRRPNISLFQFPAFTVSLFAILTAIAIPGLRLPVAENGTGNSTSREQNKTTVSVHQDNAASLDYIGSRKQLLMIIRPTKLIQSSMLRQIRRDNESIDSMAKELEKSCLEMTGVDSNEVDQITLCGAMPGQDQDGSDVRAPGEKMGVYAVCRTRSGNMEKFRELGDAIVDNADGVFILARKELESFKFKHGFIVDDRTIIWASSEKELEYVLAHKEGNAKQADWYESWKSVASRAFILLADEEMTKEMFNGPGQSIKSTLSEEQFETLSKAQAGIFAADLTGAIEGLLVLKFESNTDARSAEKTGKDLLSLATAAVKAISLDGFESDKPALKMATDCLKKIKFNVNKNQLHAKLSFTPDFDVVRSFTDSTQTAVQRTDSANRIRTLAIAMHNYHDVHGTFPPPVIMHESGKVHSWRIAILPFLEQGELYAQYHLDEDWNSEHNLGVTAKMPDWFRHSSVKERTNSSYFVVVGNGTCFDGNLGMSLEDIADGTSRTIAIVEAKRDIHWAKPEDISMEDALKRNTLGGFSEGGFNAAYADGSVHFLPKNIDLKKLKSLFTANGREEIED